jgi:beta-phosphoglucomutase family hydrolase
MTELDLDGLDAVLFDLDGVLTDTASHHASAWKQMFDEFLVRWGQAHDHPFQPFVIERDYLQYVDGKPRLEGVASFLESRRIVLPDGSPEDGPEQDTIHGLATRKNELVLRLIDEEGVDVFEGSVAFVRWVRAQGLRTAVVSSSRNAGNVLEVAGIADLFEDRIDGLVAAELGLPGKPQPDTFVEGARRLDTTPQRSVVVEDAVVGVQAGRLGQFGLVIGVDRGGNERRLHDEGADLVVSDLGELVPEDTEA